MVTRDVILGVLRTIDDPEMPISIVDLGMVGDVRVSEPADAPADDCEIDIDMLPTFIGCPALPMIEGEVRQKLAALGGVGRINVHFVFDPPWSVDRISADGRASLKVIGVTVPGVDDDGPHTRVTAAVPCPFCDSSDTELTSPFGPTRCRKIYHCQACKNSFEHMKRV